MQFVTFTAPSGHRIAIKLDDVVAISEVPMQATPEDKKTWPAVQVFLRNGMQFCMFDPHKEHMETIIEATRFGFINERENDGESEQG